MLFSKKKKKKHVHDRVDRIIVSENAMSSKVEGYNRLKDNILYLNADGKNQVIQIESSLSHEGKTTVTCNLAVSLGLTDKKVIVLDLDFRKPRVKQRFKVSIDNGMAEFMLNEDADYHDFIKHTRYKNVDTITRGAKIYNSSLVLVSAKFKQLIADLRKEYDYILLDCAPVLQVSDYIHISQISDGIIFLVAYGMTTRNQVADAIKELRKNNAKLLGTVFSMYDRKKDKSYGYGKYYGKNGNYYSYYRSYVDEEKVEPTDIKFSETENPEVAIEDISLNAVSDMAENKEAVENTAPASEKPAEAVEEVKAEPKAAKK